MGVLVGVILVYKSGLTFFLTAKTKKLVCTGMLYMYTLFYIFPKFSTLVLDELQPSVLHVNWSEFYQECNGDAPKHMTRVCHMFNTWFFISVQLLLTSDHIGPHLSVLHVNRSEFWQEFNGDGLRHVTRVCHMSDTWFFISVKLLLASDQTNIHPSVLHENRSEFYREFNGDGPRHMTHIHHMSNTSFFISISFC